MKYQGRHYRSIWFEAGKVKIIDQTRLPHEFVIVELDSLETAAEAIQAMWVRGAPLIGATGAYGMGLAMQQNTSDSALESAYHTLFQTRPTAINLRWALDQLQQALLDTPDEGRAQRAFELAAEICDEDVKNNSSIGEHGLKLIQAAAENKPVGEAVNILTHCNAGWLATVDWGTALAPIYKAHEAGIAVHVWVDETRPRNQGASLTAWELVSHGIPHHVVTDNAGGYLMQTDQVDLCIVGTDRTTAAGDVCNKIGTYLKALAAYDNHVPFCVALPGPTIDWRIQSGLEEVPIEARDEREVTHISGRDQGGTVTEIQLVPDGVSAFNPAFDITPAKYVTTLITERGLCEASAEALAVLYPDQVQ